jgi:hypothetical protein
MVTGDAATAVVTHAWRVGSRLEACLAFSPRARCLRDSCLREEIEMARTARRPSARHHHTRRSSRGRSAPFEQMHLNAAGIDVGATEHWVAVSADRDEEPVRRFGALTADLYVLAEWLRQWQIETVVLESTGVSWIALFEVLEERGFDVQLVDAHDARQVPRRKTDVKDCQWLQELHTYGLLCGAFRPEDQICVLRSYLRQRSMLVAQFVTVDRRIAPPTAASERSMIVSCHAAPQCAEACHAYRAGGRPRVPAFSHRDSVHEALADWPNVNFGGHH